MPTNSKALTPGDPRTNLEHLPDANLYDVARNSSAVHRLLCLEILVERCSVYAARDDVANEARQLIIDNPLILKEIDPASAVHTLRLPNIIDVAADQQVKRAELSALDPSTTPFTPRITPLSNPPSPATKTRTTWRSAKPIQSCGLTTRVRRGSSPKTSTPRSLPSIYGSPNCANSTSRRSRPRWND